MFSAHTEQNSFGRLGLAVLFIYLFIFWQRQTGRISSLLISSFLRNIPFDIFDNVGIGTQSIPCQKIGASYVKKRILKKIWSILGVPSYLQVISLSSYSRLHFFNLNYKEAFPWKPSNFSVRVNIT